MIDPQYIRNFSIVAHIDHGKSTLADRLLEFTYTLSRGKMVEQFLDMMDLERERGVTIKAKAVRLLYDAEDGKRYVLNLIDTPGHVDFTYEVSRSLAACEGVLLVVDAVQGVEAQTIANALLATENGLEIIPVLNKIDLPSADPERVKREIEEGLGIDAREALLVSAKTGEGVKEVLETIVDKIPQPSGDLKSPLRALIFDSYYDPYRGVIVFVRMVDGVIKAGMQIRTMATSQLAEVEEVGIFRPKMELTSELSAGEVGYLITGIRDIAQTQVGDTITDARNPAETRLSGYREPKPMVFCGLYPVDGGEYENLREALVKLKLNDPSFIYEPETSHALGFGFRCGFLGLFHMEIVKERLEREYDLELVVTAPNVACRVVGKDGLSFFVRNPSDFPSPGRAQKIEEPYVSAVILTPPDFIGAVMELCQERRGEFKDMKYLSENRVEIHYHLPLGEILLDFFNQLKSRTRGYGSLDYEHIGYRESDLVKLDILIGGQPVDAFSCTVDRDKAYSRGRSLVDRLKGVIPRQLFEVPVQAAIGSKVIARETIKARRKDVLAKCYGGDVTRKRKLLERQKMGRKRMKQIGKVEIPQEAFLAVLRVDEKR
ncbi:MAG: translation elongation factor 4 [Actinomycetota bacterium]|nr:translation elongation factor 4 [Actinomycetota bacterium]